VSRGTGVRVFVLAFLVYAYFMPQWADWNIDSRLDLVHAIVSQHTLRIDKYHYNTWDKAVDRGHYYSDKAPGTAFFGVPVLAAFYAAKKVPGLSTSISSLEANSAWNVAIKLGRSSTQKDPAPKGTNLGGCQRAGVAGNVQYIPWGNRLVRPMRDWALSKYLVTVGVVGTVSALFAVFFFWFLGIVGAPLVAKWSGTLLTAFATSSLPYSSNFYSHQLVGAFLFVAFAFFALRARGYPAWLVPAAGFLLGLALFTEYTVGIIVAVVAAFAVLTLWRRPLEIAGAALAGSIPLAALAWYNLATFGNPLDTGYSHDFCWSASQASGFQGFTYPHLGPLFDLTVGPYRGLFFSSPFLLLAIPGIYVLARKGWRAESLTCAVAGVVFILALSAFWGWNGGRVDGPRYLVPVIPFLAFPASASLPWLWSFLAGRVVAVLAGAWSLFATWALFLGGLTFPMSFARDPLFDYSLPALAANQITPNAGLFFGLAGWASLVPLAAGLLVVGAWCAFAESRSRDAAVGTAAPAAAR
jgi:hypothetical protein